jgi:glycosyltransferase 2 family protein
VTSVSDDAGPGTSRRVRLLGLAVSLVSVVAVVWWASRQDRPSFPTDARDLALVAAGIGVYALATALRGWRWHAILRGAGVQHRHADAYGLVVVGYMGNTVLPARGGEVLRVLLLGERSTSSRREILGTIVAERLLDVVSLAVFFVVMTWVGIAGSPTGEVPAAVAACLIVAGAVGATVLIRLRRAGRLHRLAVVLGPFLRASKLLVGRVGAALLGLTMGIWLLEGANFWLLARALHLPIDLTEGVLLVVLASLFAIVPAGPAYAGTFDAALIFGLAALDVRGGDAVGFAVLARFVVFVPITVAGLVLAVVHYGGLTRLRAQPAGAR